MNPRTVLFQQLYKYKCFICLQMSPATLAPVYDASDHSPWLPDRHLLFSTWHLSSPSSKTLLKRCRLKDCLYSQGQFLFSLLSFSAPTFLVLVAMSVWLTVLAAYWALAAKVRTKWNRNWVASDNIYLCQPSHEYSKATAKARLAQLDGYKVDTKGQHGGHSRKPRKR